MGEALNRPWLSEFDKEFYEFEDNPDRYPCIIPDHGNESWMTNATHNGKRLRRSFKRLDEAVKAIHQFRNNAGSA